jgi:PAS domain S-box-containing protein
MRFRSNEVKKLFSSTSIRLFPERIFDTLKEGVIIFDRKGSHIYVNHAFCSITGYSEDEILGSGPPCPYLPEKKQKQIMSLMLSGYKSCLQDIELPIKRKDGINIPVFMNGSAITDENTRQTFYMTTLNPLNGNGNGPGQKITELVHRQMEHRYRSLVENSSFGLFIVDCLSGRFLFQNKRLCEIFGYTLEEGNSLSVWNLIHPDEHESLLNTLERWPEDYENASMKSGIFTGVKKEGSIIRVEINATIIAYEGALSVQGLVNDVTRDEDVDEKLRQVQKMEAIGTLAGGISHDFNNILSAIIGYSELANFQLKKNTPPHDSLNEIIKAGYRAKELVAQILAFSRKSKNELKPMYLKPVIKEVLKLIKASLPSTIEIRENLRMDAGVVMADATQIHQIMMNLCTNAAHAMIEDGGILEVSLYDIIFDENLTVSHPEMNPGKYIVLSVSDTGHGMTPDIVDRIFEPYFTTKEKGVGTGMGLAVVHGIVKSYGGAINVQSEPGAGTIFKIYFPAVKTEPMTDHLIQDQEIVGGNEKILFIDDEAALARLWKNILENLGYSVSMMTDSTEAFRLFYSDPDYFDLVVTDMTMPGITGAKLVKSIRNIRHDIPVIVCTGYSENINEEKAVNMGINAFILKPLVTRELACKIRRVLDEHSSKKKTRNIRYTYLPSA